MTLAIFPFELDQSISRTSLLGDKITNNNVASGDSEKNLTTFINNLNTYFLNFVTATQYENMFFIEFSSFNKEFKINKGKKCIDKSRSTS